MSKTTEQDNIPLLNNVKQLKYYYDECNICLEIKEYNKMCELNCLHKFCVDCLCNLINNNNNSYNKFINCPMCRTEIKIIGCLDEECLNAIQTALF